MLNTSYYSYFSNSFLSLFSGVKVMFSFSAIVMTSFFLYLRVPCLFSVSYLVSFIFYIICPLFLALFFSRLEGGVNMFFSSLLPPGTPLWMAPFVGLAETISYIVRPFILMIRPFINITMGVLGGASLSGLVLSFNFIIPLLLFIFIYEMFVASIHSFIIFSILKFSEDH